MTRAERLRVVLRLARILEVARRRRDQVAVICLEQRIKAVTR